MEEKLKNFNSDYDADYEPNQATQSAEEANQQLNQATQSAEETNKQLIVHADDN